MIPRRAFTLLEALLALALVAMLGGSLLSFVWTLSDRTREVRRAAAREDGVSLFLDRLESDVLCGLAGGPGLGAGVQGDPSGVKIMTRGVALRLGKGGATPARDIQFGEYRVDAAGGRLRARRAAEGEAQGELEQVTGGIREARFRYHDGLAWQESFDSAARNSLPAAIEIAVWYGQPAPPDENAAPAEAAEPPSPDRVRLIVIPDGPATAVKEVL
ncbi:MAG: hypothetical protein WD749_01055 [Phycisphaerales bacterium]